MTIESSKTSTAVWRRHVKDRLGINVKDFGAVGDGVTDDTAAIQAAIDYVGGIGGGVVFFSRGVYLVSSVLNMAVKGITLKGEGPKASVIDTNSTTANIINIGTSPAYNAAGGVESMGFTSSVTRTAGYTIAVDGCEHYTLKDLKIDTNGGHGLGFSITGGLSGIGFISDIDIEITGVFQGISINGSNDQYFSNMWIRGPIFNGGTVTGSNGILIQSTGGAWFTDIEVVQFQRGVQINAGAAATNSWIHFNNVLADTNALDGWLLAGSGTNRGIVMQDCWAGTNGITDVNSNGLKATNCDGLLLSNFRAINNGGYGIQVSADSTVKNIAIRGGIVAGNSQETTGALDGIIVAGGLTGGIIIDGVFAQSAGGVADKQRYGIHLVTGATDNYTIINNFVSANLTAGINNNATGTNKTVKYNHGYVTEAKGTGSIASGTTTDVIAHGLDATPSIGDIQIVGGENPTNDIGNIWITAVGATTFTVNVRNDPGASNWDFEWSVNIL
jgi:hypothetical protein